MGIGHGADESAACRVLPVIDEEPDESEEGSHSPEMMTKQIADRRKAAIVSRMRELLRRAAAAQSAHTKLRRSTVATAKKWKRVVGRIQNRGGHHRVVTLQDDGMSSSVSSISSSKSSFSWDAESCSSAMSPSNQLVSSPAPSFIRLSCTRARISSGSDDEMRMAHWVTTDTDFIVLEL